MGAALIAGGLYIEDHHTPTKSPSCKTPLVLCFVAALNPRTVATIMGVFSLVAIFSEFGNGANFALVPHCNVYNNVSLIFT